LAEWLLRLEWRLNASDSSGPVAEGHDRLLPAGCMAFRSARTWHWHSSGVAAAVG